MSNDKPTNLEEYKKWLKTAHNIEISEKTSNYYQSVTNRIVQTVEESPYWIQFINNISELNSQYLLKTGYPLWTSVSLPKLIVKPFDSFLVKTFRKNVLDNRYWPNPPRNEWILPDNWFSKINDIIRTVLVV